MANSVFIAPLQLAVVTALTAYLAQIGDDTAVVVRRPQETLSDVNDAVSGTKRCYFVFPPLIQRLNGNLNPPYADDIEIRVSASEDPKVNLGETDVYAMVENFHLFAVQLQFAVGGYFFQPLRPDDRPTQPRQHPERVCFELVYHTSGGMAACD